jgi:SAM-dependent methyltransferase
MRPRPPTLSGLLRHPSLHVEIAGEDGRLRLEDGRPVPLVDGFPDLLPSDRPARHRFWAWVYNRISFGYDFGVRVGWKLALGGAAIDRNAYLSRLAVRPGMRVLETAAGTGDNLAALPAGADYYGFDQSVAMLRRCRSRLERAGRAAGLVLADMAAAPFKDDLFDIVLHMGGLQFMLDPRRGIAEMHRMARAGGRILIAEERASVSRMLRRSGVRGLEGLVPDRAQDIRIEEISGGELIAIEFRK